MSTKVRDKLRIQGNAAPRRGPDTTRRPFCHPAFHPDSDAPSRFVYQPDIRSLATGSEVSTIIHSHPSSAASRRQEHLQRVQQANRGLTSAEVCGASGREGLPSLHFLLRGKPVQGEVQPITAEALHKHQRVGHYKTSAKEVYRARHRAQSDLSSSGDLTNVFRAIRTPFHDDTNASTITTNTTANTYQNASNALANYFYLGPASAFGQGQSLNHTWPGKKDSRNAHVELTGSNSTVLQLSSQKEQSHQQHYSLPYASQNDEDNNNAYLAWTENKNRGDLRDDLDHTGPLLPTRDGSPRGEELTGVEQTHTPMNPSRYSNGLESMSEIMNSVDPTPVVTIRHRQSSMLSRRGARETPRLQTTDPSTLKQCLNVQRPYNVVHGSKTDMSPRDIVGLKNRSIQPRVSYNNPYRNSRTSERRDPSSANRYAFNSVESYIHFNKIYPRTSDIQVRNSLTSAGAGDTGQSANGLPVIPRLNGFTSHCTDTVLLKMMFEMNKPKSGKSTSKYSDVAVHKDLDEYMIVSTPTISRSSSVISRKSKTPIGRKSRSQISFASSHREEDEGENANAPKKDKRAKTKLEGEENDGKVGAHRDDQKEQQQELNVDETLPLNEEDQLKTNANDEEDVEGQNKTLPLPVNTDVNRENDLLTDDKIMDNEDNEAKDKVEDDLHVDKMENLNDDNRQGNDEKDTGDSVIEGGVDENGLKRRGSSLSETEDDGNE